ncbi:MAG: phenylalanine--tRNA ligase subunit alpha [Deltaproteobacteria bacterium]|nr:phenylalanine--tRNA ligase subunit alpha [Deltaproteobacteria bacterium]
MLGELLDSLDAFKAEAEEAIEGSRSEEGLEKIRVGYLGKKGKISHILKKVGSLDAKERPQLGKRANEIKAEIEEVLSQKFAHISRAATEKKIQSEGVDLTLPGRRVSVGSLHPVTTILEEICAALIPLGFTVEEGPDIETDYYNFEALNIPKDHPAREMQDTFYVSEDLLLRTHTSPVQIRTMEKYEPPMRIIAPGTVYRCDSDVTHTPMFHQVEGFVVDKNVSFAQLKGLLTAFVHKMFGSHVNLRFRPSFFPFTEPSAEVDIECVICRGDGCRVCKETGWLEILGAGMIDPEVFKAVGYDPDLYTGFAFGMGVERIAMLKYGIKDLRMFFENDVRFLNQF